MTETSCTMLLQFQGNVTTSIGRQVPSSSTLQAFSPVSVSHIFLCLIILEYGTFVDNNPPIVYIESGCNGGTLGVRGGSCIERGQWNAFRLG